MASPPKEGKLTAETAMPKPPLPPSVFVSRKSESFRGVPYAPPGEVNPVETPQEETTTGIGSFIRRMWSGSGSLPAHVSSESVVGELLIRRNSAGGKSNEGELPPKASRRSSSPPSPPTTVGLPSVTLVATEMPPSKETETLEMNAEVSEQPATTDQQSSIQKENVLENKKEEKQTPTSVKGEENVDTATAHEENEKERTGFGTPIPPEELSVVMGSSATVEAAGKEKSVEEGEKPVAMGTSAMAETPKPSVLDIQSPPTAPAESNDKSSTVEKGTGAMGESNVNVSAPVKKPDMRKAETMPKPSQQPGFIQKILSFGRAGAQSRPIVKEEEEELTKPTEAVVVEEKIPDEEPAKLSESSPLADDPSGSRMPPATPDQAAAKISGDKMDKKTETAHDRMSSELTATELDALKSSFMSEMRNKGIDVEGKYTKSSVDFDSPLMFLLDLHTFAVTQHSSVRMEDVLEEKYGAAHKMVTEFSAATARQREPQIQQLSSEQEKTVLSPEQQRQEETKGTTSSASKSTGEATEPNKLAEVVGNDRAPSEDLIEDVFVSYPPAQEEKDIASSKFEEVPPSSENVTTQKTYEEALDTAQDAVKDAKEETQCGHGGYGGDGGDGGGSSSESQPENKKPQSAVEGTEKAKSKSSSDTLPLRRVQPDSPPERPPTCDPTPSSPITPKCFMCCFYPRAD